MHGLFDDDGVFSYCSKCGGPIHYDDGTWESIYVHTGDGIMHADCAEDYYKEYIASNYKIAKRDEE